jgi:predicted transcriptional regulator
MNDIMSVMTMKEVALKTIEELPESASWEEIEETVRFVAAIEKGFEQIDKGRVIPHEQVKKNLESWLAK